MAKRGFRSLKRLRELKDLEDKKNSYKEEKEALAYLEETTNYKKLLKTFKDAIIFDGEGFSICLGVWINHDNNNKITSPRLGIRWNGECGTISYPILFGKKPHWLILDNRFAKAIIEEIPKIDKNKVKVKMDKDMRRKILKFLEIGKKKKLKKVN